MKHLFLSYLFLFFTSFGWAQTQRSDGCIYFDDQEINEAVLRANSYFNSSSVSKYFPAKSCNSNERQLDMDFNEVERHMQPPSRAGFEVRGLRDMASTVISETEQNIRWAEKKNERCEYYRQVLTKDINYYVDEVNSGNFCADEFANAEGMINELKRVLDLLTQSEANRMVYIIKNQQILGAARIQDSTLGFGE